MIIQTHRLALIAAFALMNAFVIFAAGAAAEPKYTLRYGVDAENDLNSLPQFVAEREGFMERQGLSVERVLFHKSSDILVNQDAMLLGLNNGDVDMVRLQFPYLVDEVSKGRTFAAVGSLMDNPVYVLVANKDVGSFAELKGKTVALSVANDLITLATRKLMAQHGLNSDDVKIRNILGSEPRFACLKSGECDAAAMSENGAAVAVKGGYHAIGISNDAGQLLFMLETVQRPWAQTHRDTVVKYLRAISAAMRFIHDPRNREQVVNATMDLLHQPQDRVRETLSYYWDPKYHVLPQRGEIDLKALRSTIALMGQYGILQAPLPAPDRFIDLRYAKAAAIQ